MSNVHDGPLARATSTLPGSGIRAVMDQALRIPDCLRLEIGDPNFGVPPHVAEAIRTCAGENHYTATAGDHGLRTRLADRLRQHYNMDTSDIEVVVTPGAVGAIGTALTLLVSPGDEVLIPSPSWPNFDMLVQLRNAVPVSYVLRRDSGFAPDLDEIESKITPRTSVLVVNTPSNPVGAVFTDDTLRRLGDLAKKHNLWVISDETYDEIVFEGRHVATAQACPDWRHRIFSVYSFSKTYAMTGLRVGYAAVPRALATAFVRVQEATFSCASSVSQAAALAALDGPQSYVAGMVDKYRERRDGAATVFRDRGIPFSLPHGAFYLWVDISSSGLASQDFASGLLTDQAVAVAPGSSFGRAGEGWIRISLASDDGALVEGSRRLVHQFESLARTASVSPRLEA